MASKHDDGFTNGKSPLLSGTGFAADEPVQRAKSVAEIETFITMLKSACEDPKINSQLERILSIPDAQRKSFIHNWVSDMLIAKAPKDFICAIACLSDDRVAEKTYEVIFQCKRKF